MKQEGIMQQSLERLEWAYSPWFANTTLKAFTERQLLKGKYKANQTSRSHERGA